MFIHIVCIKSGMAGSKGPAGYWKILSIFRVYEKKIDPVNWLALAFKLNSGFVVKGQLIMNLILPINK